MRSPLDEISLQRAAERLLADYDAVCPSTQFAEGFKPSFADARRLQNRVTQLREARGERVVGYKVGCISAVNQQAMGLNNPVWGRLWDTEIHHANANLSKDRFANLAIEAEFGISLSQDLPAATSLEQVLAAIASVCPLLELHNLSFKGDPPVGHELIANNCINSGVVKGEPVSLPVSTDSTDLALIFGDEIVDSWQGLRWPVDIIESVVWLAEALAKEGGQLKSGDFVLTGAWGPPLPVNDHRQVTVTSSAFGTVSASFT